MHISSLPGPYGIGSMGKHAYDFVDFLCKAGQSYWQILPLSPTGYGDSPYQSFSIFAGNPYFIDLDTLVSDGLLRQEELDAVEWFSDEGSVDYGCLYNNRSVLLKLAYERFTPDEGFYSFIGESPWLDDYGLFMALKEHFGGVPWQSWPMELICRKEEALEEYRAKLSRECGYHSFVQYIFYSQWRKLRAYANGKGLRIIGDVPIYVPLDCADVWIDPQLFQLDENRRPTGIAGCPPDSFCADGQLWGNPVYNWDFMKKEGYSWWKKRLEMSLKNYDVLRIDHFRGFDSYYCIPFGSVNAQKGQWRQGPGTDLFDVIKETYGELPIIAEDLGFLTDSVRQLLKDVGYPGMKVLQFAFDSRESSGYLPLSYTRNSVVYTGTHDNNTIKGWISECKKEDLEFALEYLRTDLDRLPVELMLSAMESVSNTCILCMQDLIGLNGFARMNKPSTVGTNWKWRAARNQITEDIAEFLKSYTEIYKRC